MNYIINFFMNGFEVLHDNDLSDTLIDFYIDNEDNRNINCSAKSLNIQILNYLNS